MRVVAKDVVLGPMLLFLACVAAAVPINVDLRMLRAVVCNVQESIKGGLSIKCRGRRRNQNQHDDSGAGRCIHQDPTPLAKSDPVWSSFVRGCAPQRGNLVTQAHVI